LNSRNFVDVPKRASALCSMRQEHFHGFTRSLAANDNRGEALTRAGHPGAAPEGGTG
jgi:hypothetical protein